MAYNFPANGNNRIHGDYRPLEHKEGRKLSTAEIMRVAGERYIQFSNNHLDAITMFVHPYGSSLSALSTEEANGADLAYLLLTAAENVTYKHYDRASRSLTRADSMAFDTGNPVQRVSYYFAAALRERINREMGRFTNQERGSKGLTSRSDLDTFYSSDQEIPLCKVTQLTAVQTVIDSVAVDVKVHIIDLQIRSGVQWTTLMQALSKRNSCPLELLKITAIATTDREFIEETGKRLQRYAEFLKIPFSFKVVFVPDMKDIKQELFDIKTGESVAVYSPTVLTTMISKPERVEALMRVIRRFKPSIMVVIEVEANHNSPSFVNRFIEALFFYSAWFDCLEDSMDRNNQYRVVLEKNHFSKGIQNIVATEGDERVTRHVKINVWREFFARFRMEETQVSTLSLSDANLALQAQCSRENSCTLDSNEKSLIVGWKRTPIFSVSAWKFD
ncbi:DELLA protein RGL1-like [Apium graveolens]|uniref:DELLA protein RGL1-like n=1 Tax=Apium graveolens TaxID=4045 RepID=UPI003D7A315D